MRTNKLCNSNTHVVVIHPQGNTSHMVIEGNVGLHKSQRILPLEDNCEPVIALAHREHGQVQLPLNSTNGQFDIAPVKLAVLTRIILLSNESLLITRLFNQYVITDNRIADIMARAL